MLDKLVRDALQICESPNAWLPDVFACVYDLVSYQGYALKERSFFEGEPGAIARGKFRAEYLGPLRDWQAVNFGSLTDLLLDYVRRQLRDFNSESYSPRVTRNLLMVLDTINWFFWGLKLGEGGADQYAYLANYRAELLANRALIRAAPGSGHLLPRAAQPARPARNVADFFMHVVRIKQPPNCELSYKFLANLRRDHRAPIQKIGVIPTILAANELDWRVIGDTYSVHSKLDVRARVIAALDWLGGHEVDLVLMPELVASPELIESIQEWRRVRTEAHPRLILAGSYMDVDIGETEWRNRAFVIGSGGQVQWIQDKMNPYTFTAKHQIDSGWPLSTPAIDLTENIQTSPQRLEVRDSPHGERFAVLICEDFARARPHHDLAMELGLNRILVPVMNGSRDAPGDWIHRYAINFAQEPVATSMIVNSGTLVNRKPAHIDDYVAMFDQIKKPVVGHTFLPDSPIDAPVAILVEVNISP